MPRVLIAFFFIFGENIDRRRAERYEKSATRQDYSIIIILVTKNDSQF